MSPRGYDMNDRSLNVSYDRILSVFLGVLGTGLIIANWFLPTDKVGFLSLPCLTISAVLQVRHYFCRMEHAEQAAFHLGRDSVRPIR